LVKGLIIRYTFVLRHKELHRRTSSILRTTVIASLVDLCEPYGAEAILQGHCLDFWWNNVVSFALPKEF